MDEDTGLVIVAIGTPFLVCGFIIALMLFDSSDVTKILMLLVAAVFALAGIIQLSGRGAWFVAGYNTMTEEEKAQYNPKAIARGSGIIMICLAVFMAAVPYGTMYLVAGLLVFVIGMLLGILVMRRTAPN